MRGGFELYEYLLVSVLVSCGSLATSQPLAHVDEGPYELRDLQICFLFVGLFIHSLLCETW